MAVARQGAWFIAETDNFQVCSLRGAAESQEVAAGCEQLRFRVAATCGVQAKRWTPRCQVVLHGDSASYLAAVGGAGEASVASALTRRNAGGVTLRKIDVRSATDDFLAKAMPHELCHVLLADQFHDVPLWCDEGLALLLDPLEKQQLHERDMQRCVKDGKMMQVEQLLALRQYPSADQWPFFYGQSASLVRYLLQRGSPQQLLQFAKLERSHGATFALRDVYRVNGPLELQRQWQVASAVPVDTALTVIGFEAAPSPFNAIVEVP